MLVGLSASLFHRRSDRSTGEIILFSWAWAVAALAITVFIFVAVRGPDFATTAESIRYALGATLWWLIIGVIPATAGVAALTYWLLLCTRASSPAA